MTDKLIRAEDAHDNDLIRRGDAIRQATRWVRGFVEADTVGKAIAALPAVAPGVRVKPLLWSENYCPVASPEPYQIWPDNGGSGAPDDPIEDFDGFMLYSPHLMALGVHPTHDAAKAAAQADYEARILSALKIGGDQQ